MGQEHQESQAITEMKTQFQPSIRLIQVLQTQNNWKTKMKMIQKVMHSHPCHLVVSLTIQKAMDFHQTQVVSAK